MDAVDEPAVSTSESTGSPATIGFIGLGAMGKGQASCLARNLKANGHPPLVVYNRDPSKLALFMSETDLDGCVQAAASLEELALRCSLVFMMLSHDGAVGEVVGHLTAALAAAPPLPYGQPRILVDSSTVSPETTRDMSVAAAAVGAQYVACPVLGRPDAAAAGNLLIFCSGPEDAKQRLAPYLAAMGRKVLDLGSEPQKANIMKLLANFHLVSLIELLSEGMTLAEKNGISRGSYMSFIDEVLPVPIVHGYGSRIAADAFDSGLGFTVTLGLKDVNLMRKLAESSESPLPLADIAFNHLLAAKASGLADKDWAALAVSVRRAAGMPE